MQPSTASIPPCILLLFTDLRSYGFSKLFSNTSNESLTPFMTFIYTRVYDIQGVVPLGGCGVLGLCARMRKRPK